MSEKVVPIKEVLRFGYDTTKKNFGRILQFAIIFIALFTVKGVIDHFDGDIILSYPEIYSEYSKNITLKDDLRDHGYIAGFGLVQPKLQALTSPFDLELSPEFQTERAKIYELLQTYRNRLPLPQSVTLILKLILWLIEMFLYLGAINISLVFADGKVPEISTLFDKKHLFLKYVIGLALYNVVIVIGFLLFIVPGIIWSIKLQFWAYQIVEGKSEALQDAFRASSTITDGAKMDLFKLGAILMLVNIVGAVCLLVGLIFTMPLTYITCAYVYRKLKSQTRSFEISD